MQKAASTSSTPFWKPFSMLFGLVFGLGALWCALQAEWRLAIPFGAIALFNGLWPFWYRPPLCKVSFDEEALYLSDGNTNARVSWADVADIRRRVWVRWPTYIISFKRPEPFGGAVSFAVPMTSPISFNTDLVAEMQEILQRHTQNV